MHATCCLVVGPTCHKCLQGDCEFDYKDIVSTCTGDGCVASKVNHQAGVGTKWFGIVQKLTEFRVSGLILCEMERRLP